MGSDAFANQLDALVEDAPLGLDLTNPRHLESIRSMADSLLRFPGSQLNERLPEVLSDRSLPVSVGVAAKLAWSRLHLERIDRPVHVSIVIAVYKEHIRILPPSEHPAGEDFLREKLRQLRWLFGPNPRHTWDLTLVDDGCPEGSGRIAQAVFDEFALPGEEVRVLFLEEGIREQQPILGGLKSAAESQKGGAIRFGLWHAIQRPRGPDHVALFTDADLSTHLGQIGLLVSPIVSGEALSTIGSRRDPASVVVKARGRDIRGKLFIYLWKRLLPQLRGIVDTQCGFKAFDAHELATWIGDTRDNGFSFDVEFLVHQSLRGPEAIRTVPIAWIDSEAASTTRELEPYLPMLRSVSQLYRLELPPSPQAEPFADLIDRLDADTFVTLSANVPAPIANREPHQFDDFDGVSAEELASAAGL